MSDTKRLDEGTIRRFMKLAKIEGLADGFVEQNSVLKEGSKSGGRSRYVAERPEDKRAQGRVEEKKDEKGEEVEEGAMHYEGEEEMTEQDELMGDMGSDEMGGMGMGGEGGEAKAVITRVINAIGEEFPELGIQVDDEGGMEDDGAAEEEDMEDEEEGVEDEEMDMEDEEEDEEEGEEEVEEANMYGEKEEEDSSKLQEAILARVKARLLAEARKGGKAMTAKQKMKMKKKAKSGKPTDEAKKHGPGGSGMAKMGKVGKGKVSTPFSGAAMEETAKGGKPKGHGAGKGTFGTKNPGPSQKMKPAGATGPKKHKA